MKFCDRMTLRNYGIMQQGKQEVMKLRNYYMMEMRNYEIKKLRQNKNDNYEVTTL